MKRNLILKIRSQKGIILKEMKDNPGKWFLISHFCGKHDHCFVGYKASARMSELQTEGLLVSRWSGQKTALGGRLKEYRLANNVQIKTDPERMQYFIKKPFQFSLF